MKANKRQQPIRLGVAPAARIWICRRAAELQRYAAAPAIRGLSSTAVAITLCGCPKATSVVEHYTEHARLPDTSCVLARLVDIATHNDVRQIDDVIPLGTNHRFLFEIGGVITGLSILDRRDATASIRLTAWAPHHRVRELEQARRSIGEVEQALFGHCALANSLEAAEETCFGRRCDQLLAKEQASLRIRSRGER